MLSFPLATKMFQFARLSLACPWIQQQLERLNYSEISGSMLIFNSPKQLKETNVIVAEGADVDSLEASWTFL